MSMQDADDLLSEDRDIIEGLVNKYKSTKDNLILVEIAKKADSLADLYFAAFEELNERFFEYKKLSAEYYDKASQELNLPNARVLSILLYIQANELSKAEKKLKSLKTNLERKFKRKNKHQKIELNDEIIYALESLIIPNIKRTGKILRAQKSVIDENLYKVFEKTIDYAKKIYKLD